MTSRYEIDPTRVTTVLTSCGHFGLLEKTVTSFLKHFAASQIVVAEDSEKPNEAAAFAEKFPAVEMRINEPKLGQMRSIDKLYATLLTPLRPAPGGQLELHPAASTSIALSDSWSRGPVPEASPQEGPEPIGPSQR